MTPQRAAREPDGWPPIRRALKALAYANRDRSPQRKKARLQEMAEHLAVSPAPLSDAAPYELAAAVTSGLRALGQRLVYETKASDEQLVLIWYLQVCERQSEYKVGKTLSRSRSWVYEHSGTSRTAAEGWRGAAQLVDLVRMARAAVLGSVHQTDVATAAAGSHLSVLGSDSRALALVVSCLAADTELSEALAMAASGWHDTYPPIRLVLQDGAKLQRAINELVRANVLRRDGGRLTMLAGVREYLLRTQDADARFDAVGQLTVLLANGLDADTDDPMVRSQWQPLAEHVAAVCDLGLDLRTDPKPISNLLDRLGIYFVECYDPKRGVAAARKAVAAAKRGYGRLHPEVAIRDYNLARALDRAGRERQALKAVDEAVAIRRERVGRVPLLAYTLTLRADIHCALGNYAASATDHEEAIRLLRDCEVDPEDLVEAYNDYAITREKQGEDRQALHLWRTALDLDPGSHLKGRIAVNVGDALLKLRRWKQASEALEDALDLLHQPGHPELRWHEWRAHRGLGEAYQARGMTRESRRHYELAVSLDDRSIEAGLQ